MRTFIMLLGGGVLLSLLLLALAFVFPEESGESVANEKGPELVLPKSWQEKILPAIDSEFEVQTVGRWVCWTGVNPKGNAFSVFVASNGEYHPYLGSNRSDITSVKFVANEENAKIFYWFVRRHKSC